MKPWSGLLVALALATSVAASAQAPAAPSASLDEILRRAGDAVVGYYERAQRIMSTETVVQQELGWDLAPAAMSFQRRLVYDRRIEWDASIDGQPAEARIQRQLVSANNRIPRPNDKPKCFDPSTTESDAIQMLLPVNRPDYVFKLAGRGRTEGQDALMVDFSEAEKGPISVRKKEGVEGCFHIDMPGQSRGRIWLTPDSFEVLRIDTRLKGPVSVRKSAREIKDRWDIDSTFERVDESTIYKPVTFADPVETLLLPASIVNITVQTGSRRREATTFTGYRRFVTDARIVE